MNIEDSLVIKLGFNELRDDYIEGRLATSEDYEKAIDDWLARPGVSNFIRDLQNLSPPSP